MKIKNRKSVFSELKGFCHLSQENDFIEVTEWTNGEGYDIGFKDGVIQITHGQLSAIECLVRLLDAGGINEN